MPAVAARRANTPNTRFRYWLIVGTVMYAGMMAMPMQANTAYQGAPPTTMTMSVR